MNTTLYEPTSRVGNAYVGALRGVHTKAEVRFLAPDNAPSTGEVRLQAVDVQMARVGDGIKDGVRVRTWGPPV